MFQSGIREASSLQAMVRQDSVRSDEVVLLKPLETRSIWSDSFG